jgi:hypothetical protein
MKRAGVPGADRDVFLDPYSTRRGSGRAAHTAPRGAAHGPVLRLQVRAHGRRALPETRRCGLSQNKNSVIRYPGKASVFVPIVRLLPSAGVLLLYSYPKFYFFKNRENRNLVLSSTLYFHHRPLFAHHFPPRPPGPFGSPPPTLSGPKPLWVPKAKANASCGPVVPSSRQSTRPERGTTAHSTLICCQNC